jgi:Tfp pilus assembly protein PilN
MPYINLIQEQRSAARRSEVRARASFFGFVGVSLVSVMTYGSLFLRNDSLKSTEARLQADLQKLEPIKKKIEDNAKLAKELEPRLTSLQDAETMTDRWVHILTHFTTQTPPDTWLTGVKV